ncbi:FitA-like ribbon-helix-helix domain-containing protein [Duganella rivi]|uniref:FitA-like ribbon-helix-helix domain-containing protein n=1 Tax=Duganella rivi TaxID=2666083 RepID=UPI001C2CA98D|nr:hypothetical protein [Duganella rivi]
MATNLLISDIEPDLVAALAERAAQHGRSAEEEHREILRLALQRQGRPDAQVLLARARELRAMLSPQVFFAREIDAAKRAGRK